MAPSPGRVYSLSPSPPSGAVTDAGESSRTSEMEGEGGGNAMPGAFPHNGRHAQQPPRHRAPPVRAIPTVGSSQARVPTQYLEQKSSVANGKQRDSDGFRPYTAANGAGMAGPSRQPKVDHHEQGQYKHLATGTRSADVKNEIDLTTEDVDDFEFVDAKGPDVIAHPDELICLGTIQLVVTCIYGLPAELQWPEGATIDTINRAPKWQRENWACRGLGYILEPGYRPVDITTSRINANGRAEIAINSVIPPFDMEAHRRARGEPVPARCDPGVIFPAFGELTESHARALYPLLQMQKIRTLSRIRLASRFASMNFMHAVEALVFCSRKDASMVKQHLQHYNIILQLPSRYDRFDFEHEPELDESGFRTNGHRNAQPFLQSRGTLMQSKEDTELEKRKQVDAVYASLPDGESYPSVLADDNFVKTRLLPHQEKALAFLLDREKRKSFYRDGKDGGIVSLWKPRWMSNRTIVSYENVVTQNVQMRAPGICYGAILADDMGLGKTLTTLSLIANTMDDARDWCKKPILSDGKEDETGAAGGAVGAKGTEDDEDDEVTIEDFSFNLSGIAPPAKRGRKQVSAKMKPKGKRELRRGEAESKRLAEIKKRSRATLLVLPLTLVTAWEGQIHEHWNKRDLPKIYVHHGPTRLGDSAKIAKHNIVMTTYSTLAAEYGLMMNDEDESSDGEDEDADQSTGNSREEKAAKRKKDARARKRKRRQELRERRGDVGAGPLQQIEWYRIVLDEAHTIKEARTLQARAVSYLIARNRVCLTGTPVQNKIDDLFSLLRFLRLEPFDDRTVWNQFCGSGSKPSLNTNGRRIAAETEKNDEVLDTTAIARIQTIMKFLTLRRTKESRTSDGEMILKLPQKFGRTLQLEFEPQEKATYNEMRLRYKDEFEEMKANNTLKYNYATILHEISNLRMTCDHMELVEVSKDVRRQKEAGEEGVAQDPGQVIQQNGISRDRAVRFFDLLCGADQARCAICSFDLSNFVEMASGPGSPSEEVQIGDGGESKRPVLTRCTHLFCSDCLRENVRRLGVDDVFTSTDEQFRFDCPACGEAVSPLTEMRALLPGDVEQKQGANVLAKEKFGVDAGTPIDQRSDYSTKIRALMQDLETFSRSNRRSRLYDPSAPHLDQVAADATEREAGRDAVYVTESASTTAPIKSVIFSQWTTMLDRIARAVHRAGIKAAYLDGRMRRQERTDNLEKFRVDPSYEVLLVSLKAGGVGLNLVSACRAYLMEPYWNPATENQGLDRIHRMGQVRPVVTTKYVMTNSIEERMLDLQRRKTQLAESVGAKRRGPMDRVEELSILFGDGDPRSTRRDDGAAETTGDPTSSRTASEASSP